MMGVSVDFATSLFSAAVLRVVFLVVVDFFNVFVVMIVMVVFFIFVVGLE